MRLLARPPSAIKVLTNKLLPNAPAEAKPKPIT